MMNDQWTVEIIVIFIVGCAIYLFNKRRIYLLSWRLPGPPALPIIGNALMFFCKNEDLFERAVELSSNYPSPLRFWFGTKFSIIITDVGQAEKVMSSVKFATKDKVYRFIKEFNGEGLISGSGPKWKRDRRLMSPLFLKKNIMPCFPYIVHHVNILVKLMEEKVDQSEFDVDHLIHRCATDFVNETIIGAKTNAQNGELDVFLKYLKVEYAVVHARIVKVWLQVEWIFRLTSYWKLQEAGKKNIHGFLRNVIENVKENHACTGNTKNTFRNLLDQLLDIRDEVPSFATDEELLHHITTLYSASEDTITTISSFALLLLGMHPNIQNKVFEEISDVVGVRDIEESDLPKLVYMDMVIKETLRLFPIAPFIARESSQDYQLDEWLIPQGCTVIVAIYNIHRDGRHWEKPNEFYPEHFLRESVETRHPYAFLPFSAGPRGCLGKPYAYMSLKILLVAILQSYTIEADGKLKDIRLKTDISVRARDEPMIRIKRRHRHILDKST